MEHVRVAFNNNAKRLVREAISNALDSSNKWLLEKVCKTGSGVISKSFIYLFDGRTIRAGKTGQCSFLSLVAMLILFWSIHKCVQVTISWLEDHQKLTRLFVSYQLALNGSPS
jgi:hypothetical protein